MIQSNKGVAKPRDANILRNSTGRPKGMGRRNPHSAVHTKKLRGRHAQYDCTALAIERGLTKISMFLHGQPVVKKQRNFNLIVKVLFNFF